jgi:coenzyme Q-binding protein COQ10
MPHYAETRILPYSPEQLFALVADVEHYPQFLPWCRAVRVLERKLDHFIAEMIITFSHITERYASKVTPVAPTAKNPGRIDVALVSGPFNYLINHWEFHPHPQGTELQFAVDFEFKSKLLNTLIGGMFTRASEKMVAAFTKRAEALYGVKATSSS